MCDILKYTLKTKLKENALDENSKLTTELESRQTQIDNLELELEELRKKLANLEERLAQAEDNNEQLLVELEEKKSSVRVIKRRFNRFIFCLILVLMLYFLCIKTYKYTSKSKQGNILQDKNDFDDVFSGILKKNDYLMIKGSNATGLNKLSKNIIRGTINVI